MLVPLISLNAPEDIIVTSTLCSTALLAAFNLSKCPEDIIVTSKRNTRVQPMPRSTRLNAPEDIIVTSTFVKKEAFKPVVTSKCP